MFCKQFDQKNEYFSPVVFSSAGIKIGVWKAHEKFGVWTGPKMSKIWQCCHFRNFFILGERGEDSFIAGCHMITQPSP